MGEIIYTIKDVGHLLLSLKEINLEKGWEVKPEEYISAYYSLDKPLRKRCSGCEQVEDIIVVEGLKFLERKGKRLDNYHQTFRLLCNGCVVARRL